jgi:hypothetical protein
MTSNDRPAPDRSVWPYIGVGCLTTVVGFFGGGMIGALVGKIAGAVRGCVPPEGFPACETWAFVLPGALLGAVLLPTIAVRRLRQGRTSASEPTDTR